MTTNETINETTESIPMRDMAQERLLSATAAQLQADLRKSRPFESGTVIVWESIGERQHYAYAAIFAGGRWYTTLQENNRWLKTSMTHEELMTYFSERGDHLAGLRVASSFEHIGF